MSIRISLIQALIDINERIYFYPKLKSFYKDKADTLSLHSNSLTDLMLEQTKVNR
jgi:hypothetical protein